MPGRIRTIKPELLEDSKTGRLTSEAFRLFIGMILLADDHGGCRASPNYLEGHVFWGSPPETTVEELLCELSAVGLIRRYEIEGQHYAVLSGWQKHQRVDHPSKPRVPRPDSDHACEIPPPRTFVYFIEDTDRDAIKIGFSHNPRERLARLSTGNPSRLKLVGCITGTTKDEADIHRRFSSLRMSGEWFTKSAEIMEFIASRENLARTSREPRDLLAPDPDPDPDPDPTHADLPVGGGLVAGKAEKSEGYIKIQDEDWGDEPSIPQLQLTLVEPPAPKRPQIAPGALEALYRLYPRKEGKKRGLEALGRLLRDATDPNAKLAEVERAVKSYARLCAREQRDPTKIKHFDTFMNNWTDYIDCDPPPLPASRPPVYNAPAATISDAERTEVMSMVQDLGKKLRGGFA